MTLRPGLEQEDDHLWILSSVVHNQSVIKNKKETNKQ